MNYNRINLFSYINREDLVSVSNLLKSILQKLHLEHARSVLCTSNIVNRQADLSGSFIDILNNINVGYEVDLDSSINREALTEAIISLDLPDAAISDNPYRGQNDNVHLFLIEDAEGSVLYRIEFERNYVSSNKLRVLQLIRTTKPFFLDEVYKIIEEIALSSCLNKLLLSLGTNTVFYYGEDGMLNSVKCISDGAYTVENSKLSNILNTSFTSKVVTNDAGGRFLTYKIESPTAPYVHSEVFGLLGFSDETWVLTTYYDIEAASKENVLFLRSLKDKYHLPIREEAFTEVPKRVELLEDKVTKDTEIAIYNEVTTLGISRFLSGLKYEISNMAIYRAYDLSYAEVYIIVIDSNIYLLRTTPAESNELEVYKTLSNVSIQLPTSNVKESSNLIKIAFAKLDASEDYCNILFSGRKACIQIGLAIQDGKFISNNTVTLKTNVDRYLTEGTQLQEYNVLGKNVYVTDDLQNYLIELGENKYFVWTYYHECVKELSLVSSNPTEAINLSDSIIGW